MDTLYRKVIIKSEQDLPKEGEYWVFFDGDIHHYTLSLSGFYENKAYWLKDIDWYLQPVEPQEQFERFSLLKQTESVTSTDTVLKVEQKQTAEEIKNKVANNNNFDSFERAIRYTFNRKLLQSEKEFIDKLFLEAMEEYAQYAQQERAIEVTDEEIINYALNYVAHKDLKPANKGLIKDAIIIGAKALRDGKMLI